MGKKTADTLTEMLADMQRTRVSSPVVVAPAKQDNLEAKVSHGKLLENPEKPSDLPRGYSKRIEVALLDDSPSQYRMVYPVEEIDQLGKTLEAGQVELIRVRAKPGGRYEILAGHRRKRAALSRGITHLDAWVVDVDDKRAAAEIILNNETHESVGDFERATGYQRMISMGFKSSEIADALGIGKSLVSKRMAFFDLPEDTLTHLREYPRAYSHHTAAQLLDILKESPSLAPDVAAGTKRVGMGEWSPQSLISVLRKRQGALSGKASEPLSITDPSNRTILTVQPKDSRKVEIVLAKDVDQALFIQSLMDMLKERVRAESFRTQE